MAKNKAQNEQQDKFILVSDNVADIYTAWEDKDKDIRAGGMAYPKSSLNAIPMRNGGLLYLVKATPFTTVQAEEIAKLKRSAILAGLFSGIDDDRRSLISTSWPWLVVVLSLIIAIILK